jgi:hypothetical protein
MPFGADFRYLTRGPTGRPRSAGLPFALPALSPPTAATSASRSRHQHFRSTPTPATTGLPVTGNATNDHHSQRIRSTISNRHTSRARKRAPGGRDPGSDRRPLSDLG